MHDPVKSFESIRNQFLLYIRTAFATQFAGIEAERERQLRAVGAFCQEPWLEPLPVYKSSRKRLVDLKSADVPSMSDQDRSDLVSLAKAGLMGDQRLHAHQLEMLRLV